VSFTKGCYLGQEVVERIRSRGHVNRKLTGLLLDTTVAPAPGAAVRAEGREVGRVTSAVRSPALGRAIALAYLNKDFWTPGIKVEVTAGEESIGATVTDPPFVAGRTASTGASARPIGEP
jgi:glycine cleavage system aminomethyltransferase T